MQPQMPVSPNQYMPQPSPAIHAKMQELMRTGLALDQNVWKDCHTKAMLLVLDELTALAIPDDDPKLFSYRVNQKFEEVALAQIQFFIDNSARIKLAAAGMQLPPNN